MAFGAQAPGVSAGRLLDGATNIFSFPGSASPPPAIIACSKKRKSTKCSRTPDPPLEDAVELHNPTAAPLDISRWYLSNSGDNFRKYQVPPGTIIASNGYFVIYEYNLTTAQPTASPSTRRMVMTSGCPRPTRPATKPAAGWLCMSGRPSTAFPLAAWPLRLAWITRR